jgi:hypothetical protein
MPSSFGYQHEATPTTGGGVQIDDATASTTTAYSGQKIEDEIALLVTAEDAPQLPETTDEHRVVLTTATERIYEDGLRIYRESNNAINIGDHEEGNRSVRDESICIGLSSGCLGNATHQKTCVGYQAARGTSGDQIVCMGVRAFQGSTGSNLTALGHYSMSQCNAGTGSTAVGHYAGQFSTNLTDSVVVGNSAGRNLTGTGLERCVGLGASALFDAQDTYDTYVIGESAGSHFTGGRSLGIGRQALSGATGDRLIALGTNALGNGFSVSAFSGNDKFVVGENTSAAVTKPYILDCDMGTTDATRIIRLNADGIHVGSSLPTSYDAGEPNKIWVNDNTLRVGNFVGGASGVVETEGYFLKGSNTTWYADEFIELRWDGFDEVFLRHTGAAGIPSDVYATSHVNTNSVSFPSSNPMIISSTDNDFLQRSSAFFSDFTIRSDSNATAFPYYKIHFEVSGSSGTTYCYWTVKKYPI